VQPQNLSEFASACHLAQSPGKLWWLTHGFLFERDARRMSYHLIDGSQGPANPIIRAKGIPDDWLRRYIDESLFEIDPITALAARRTQPFYWSDIGHLVTLSAPERGFLAELETAHLGDGLAMQVYGPNMRHAYVGLCFVDQHPKLSEGQIFELKSAVQLAHLRYCEMTAHQMVIRRDLSPREEQILGWIARGKSNGVIAEILGLSRHTVDTNVRRIFDKLSVTDRTSAVLRGLGQGLILMDRGPGHAYT
jgi:DNA-binding CsgD family transcriptional regulator